VSFPPSRNGCTRCQLADPAAKKFLPEEQVEQIQRRAEEIKARVSPDVPEGVTAQLRPYQLEGFHFLAYLSENRFWGHPGRRHGAGQNLADPRMAGLVARRETASYENTIPKGRNPKPIRPKRCTRLPWWFVPRV